MDQRSKCKKIKTTEGVEDLSVFIVLRVEKSFLIIRGIQKLSWNAGIFVNIKIINVCKKKKQEDKPQKIFSHITYIFLIYKSNKYPRRKNRSKEMNMEFIREEILGAEKHMLNHGKVKAVQI